MIAPHDKAVKSVVSTYFMRLLNNSPEKLYIESQTASHILRQQAKEEFASLSSRLIILIFNANNTRRRNEVEPEVLCSNWRAC